MAAKKIIITGGTGMIGTRLTEHLLKKGYDVAHLVRNKRPESKVKTFTWDLKKMTIEKPAYEYFENIVHLAGANIGAQKWSTERKKLIIKSRTETSGLLVDAIKDAGNITDVFISASAVGYYGGDTGELIMRENDPPGIDFLSKVTQEWEKSVDPVEALGARLVKLRFGLVLDKDGGVLQKMAQPVRIGLGAPIGSGKQYMSWIHIDDLCRLIINGLENSFIKGTYNAVAPNPVTNRKFTEAIAKELGKPMFLPNVPGFVLKMMMGEMAEMALGGNKVSNEKLIDTGFEFEYKNVEDALKSTL